ncbi:MAG TPA: XdhC family protein [Bryobacteraceae bacterium]|jgi:xanthine/CO dehydrogenase XdhC/CoxF family maturation factor|nr:XdhC family protein [Bryobacteraceae bacterium]
MREIEQILQLWQQARKSGQPAVLATVVRTQGSSYRLPGARLLLLKDGRRAGSISGGCLEGDLLAKGWWLTEKGPIVRRYDTNADGEIGSGGFGLGCNGIIHVLVERITPDNPGILEALAEVRATRKPLTVCHRIAPETLVGTDIVRQSDGTTESELPESQVFVETLTPPVRLLIFGAGEDAIPLAEMASYLGWRTHVYDGRAQYIRPNRFASAEEVAIRPPGSAEPLPIDAWTVAVLMTHSYSQDLDILRQLAASPTPRYVGILGPRKRTVQLLADAKLNFVQLGEVLHSPMGLDIGADGPEQVAVAVMAEIQAVLNGRKGGLLRDRRGSIHAPDSNIEEDTETKEGAASGQFTVGSIACA